MSNVKLETLTAVHVGSGNFLQNRTEFFQSGNALYVTDERKVLDIIGTNHVQEWIQSISHRNSIVDVVHRFAPHAAPDTFSKRRIGRLSIVSNTDTLKECIHDGRGLAYIPGSSLKGAIRTAVLATLAEKAKIDESQIVQGRKVSASSVEKQLFGPDPNRDVFRFLQVGDAFFSSGCEVAMRMVMHLNITQQQDLVTHEKPQLVEAIKWGKSSSFRMNINEQGYRLAEENGAVQPKPAFLHSMKDLLQLCNDHTIRLLEGELDFWDELADKDYDGADDYLDWIDDMRQKAETCRHTNSCILRLGHAVGWKFITGGWSRKLHCFDPNIIDASRPHNQQYQGYPFPKSRRADENSELLGFVKLTLED